MISPLDFWARVVNHPRLVPVCRLLVICCGALCALWMLLHVMFYPAVAFRVMEDAYFFTRYAHNFLRSGVFSWNAGEPATFGNTAQLYQFFTAFLFWLTGEKQITTLLLGSVTGGIAAVAVTLAAYWRLWGGQMPRLGWVLLLAALLYLFSNHSFLRGMDSGMETGWGLAFSAACIWAIFRVEREAGRLPIGLAVAMALLLYLLRPDAILLPLVALAGAFAVSRNPDLRRRLAWTALAIVVGLAVILFVEWLYYGIPVPLSVYGKIGSLTIYPPTILKVYRHDMALSVFQFMQENVLLLLPICILLWHFNRVSAVTRGMIFAVAVFFGFHIGFTIPIMSQWSRFIMPALPFAVVLALQGVHLAVAGGIKPLDDGEVRRRMASPIFAGVVLALLALRVPQAMLLHGNDARLQRMSEKYTDEKAVLTAISLYFQFYASSLPKLAAVLAPGCSVASTEHGRLSALLLDNRMIDLAGLHDPNIARHGFSASLILDTYKPDVLFAPHTHYIEWTRMLQAHPAWQRDYAVYPLSEDEGHLVALRRDSPCFEAVRPIYQNIAGQR